MGFIPERLLMMMMMIFGDQPVGRLVMVPGSVEAERMFSTMSFLKDKLWNRLTTHLSPCARLYSQHRGRYGE